MCGRVGACAGQPSSASDEVRLLLREEGRVADAEILGVEAVEALVELGGASAVDASASRCANFLCQRATSGAPSAMRSAVARASAATCVIGDDARDETFVLRLRASNTPPSSRISSATAATDQSHQRRHLRIGHHQPEVLDRRAEAARLAADAQVAQRSDLQTAADADAVDLRHERVAAVRRVPARSRASPCRTRTPAPCSNAPSRTPRCRCPAKTLARRHHGSRCSAHRRWPTARATASPSPCHIGLVSALSLSARLRTTVAIGPSRSTRMVSSID